MRCALALRRVPSQGGVPREEACSRSHSLEECVGLDSVGRCTAHSGDRRAVAGVECCASLNTAAEAHVFLRDFGAAKAELTRAHEIAAARYGKDDRRTKRIAEVLESVQQHVVAAPAAA